VLTNPGALADDLCRPPRELAGIELSVSHSGRA
jgi:hypothetical protein